jgi:hypothetical protein
LFGNQSWNQIDSIQHSHGLLPEARHHHGNASGFQEADDFFYGVEACLINMGNLLHPENHDPYVGKVLRDVLKGRGESKEQRAIQVFYKIFSAIWGGILSSPQGTGAGNLKVRQLLQ